MFVLSRRAAARLLGILLVGAVSPAGVGRADTLSRAQITIEGSSPEAISAENEITWLAEGGKPRSELTFYLSRDVTVTSVAAAARSLSFSSEPLSGTRLRAWTVRLDSKLKPGERRVLRIRSRVNPAGSPGIHVGRRGGYFLPGSGWFPSSSRYADELPGHTTTFHLPEGIVGIAAGTRSGRSGPWAAPDGARPYAVWGAYAFSRAKASAPEGSAGEGREVSFELCRPAGRAFEEPPLELFANLVGALETGLGEAAGSGDWKLVDVGAGVLRGGQRTLFWDRSAQGSGGGGRERLLWERDVAGALAEAFWSESMRFDGEEAAWLSRAIALYLGDVARAALDSSEDRTALEAVLIGARRAEFLKTLAEDRPLDGMVALSAGASRTLATRGALVAHMAADVASSRSRWIALLRAFRFDFAGRTADASAFWEAVGKRYPKARASLRPFFESTDLPDFRIVDHGRGRGKFSERYRVLVANRGKVPAVARVAAYTADGHRLFEYRLPVEAGAERAVLFRDPERIGRVVIDPRGITPQPDLSGERVEIERSSPPASDYVPSFPFQGDVHEVRAVEGFHLELEGVSIADFNGYLEWYETHHGPSGACLFGKGTVEVHPGGAFAESFREAMGRASLTFRGAREMWIRFPLSAWQRIRPQLGGRVDPKEAAALIPRARQIFQFSFPTYFYERSGARIPAPGSALVIFTTAGGERRGFVREPLPGGRVRVRLWDHLHGETLWEEIR